VPSIEISFALKPLILADFGFRQGTLCTKLTLAICLNIINKRLFEERYD
jgi:hypothetical protein